MKMNRDSETGLTGMGHTLLHKRFCLMSLLWIINLSIDSLYDRTDRSIDGSTVHFMSNDKSGSHHLIIIFEWSAECVQSSISLFEVVIYSIEATDDNKQRNVCVCTRRDKNEIPSTTTTNQFRQGHSTFYFVSFSLRAVRSCV